MPKIAKYHKKIPRKLCYKIVITIFAVCNKWLMCTLLSKITCDPNGITKLKINSFLVKLYLLIWCR